MATRGRKTISKITVGTEAVRLNQYDSREDSLLIKNSHATATIYLGASSAVTATTGFPLGPGETMIDEISNDDWWAIVAVGTADVFVIEVM